MLQMFYEIFLESQRDGDPSLETKKNSLFISVSFDLLKIEGRRQTDRQ